MNEVTYSPQQFFRTWGLLVGLTGAGIIASAQTDGFWAAYTGLSWLMWAFMGAYAVLMFVVGRYLQHHPNPQLFGQFFLLSIGFKMFLCLIIFIIYIKKYPPTDKLLVIPFLGIYTIFTIHEVYFLNKLSVSE